MTTKAKSSQSKSSTSRKQTTSKTQTSKTQASKTQAATRTQAARAQAQGNQGSPVVGLVVGIVIALFLEIANFGILGVVGGWIKTAETGLFGVMAYIFPVFIVLVLILAAVGEKMAAGAGLAASGLFLCIDVLVHLLSDIDLTLPVTQFWDVGVAEVKGGGIVGGTIAAGLNIAVSKTGALIVIILLIFLCLFGIVRKQVVEAIREKQDDRQRMKAAERRAAKGYETNRYDTDDYDDETYAKGKVSVVKKQGHKREQTVFETDTEDGTTIKIVHSPARLPRTKRAKLSRTKNKTEGLRDGSVEIERANKKIRGVGDNTTVGENPTQTQEVHEITNAQTIATGSQAAGKTIGSQTSGRTAGSQAAADGQAAGSSSRAHQLTPEDFNPDAMEKVEPEAKKPRFKITDVSRNPEGTGTQNSGIYGRENQNSEHQGAGTQNFGVHGSESRDGSTSHNGLSQDTQNFLKTGVRGAAEGTASGSGYSEGTASGNGYPAGNTQAGGASKAQGESIFKDSNSPDRANLSGKVLSSGEPVKTFKPVHVEKNNFTLPGMNLLANKKITAGSNDNVEQTAETLEKVLTTFGVNATVEEVQVGPSVTRFELKPELGTRVSKVTSLADDLKLNLAVPEIRIEAPIPGKALIGIEIPNKSRQTVYLKELLEDAELKNHKSKIAFAAGKDISGNVVVADIAKMPHLLVAGTTGSGKSVFLNSIIMCILYRATPAEVGLLIIDPKKVEFGVYAGIPHLMKSVVSDPGQAVSTLRWAVAEMTDRYQRMQMCGVRDFATYNQKYDAGQISEEEENPRRMQQIVIVIDELADLMMVAAKEVESLICRLAQLARAAGIHLIIATQRPSVDVVTGLIKANIPARAALLVASGVDSRTIIDMVGAEKLLGNGDMLFYPTGYVKPVRVQAAFVSDDEIRDTVRFLIEHKTEDFYAEDAANMEKFISGEASTDASGSGESGENGASRYDEFFYEAGIMCIEQQKASSSMIQRRFGVGFNRAARIIDQLYEFGAVGPQNGSKPREILVDSITFKEMYEELNS